MKANRRWFFVTAMVTAAFLAFVFSVRPKADGEGALSLTNASGERGGEVELTLSVENPGDLATLLLELSFPDDLTLLGVTPESDVFQTSCFTAGQFKESPYRLLWIDGLAPVTGSGALVTLRFEIGGDASPGDLPVNVRCLESFDYEGGVNTIADTTSYVHVEGEETQAGSANFRYSLVLSDSIDVRFYVTDLEEGTDLQDYTITYRYVDPETGEEVRASETMTDRSSNAFVIARCAAKQMTEPAHVAVKYRDTLLCEGDCSVKMYCESVFRIYGASEKEEDKKIVELCRAALDYGRYAQETFGYRTNALANGGVDYHDVSAVTIPASEVGRNGECTGVPTASFSLVTTSQTEFRFTFRPLSDVASEDLLFRIGETETTPFEENGKFTVCVGGIAAKQLGDAQTVTVTNLRDGTSLTVTASPLAYLYAARNSTQQMLVKALYRFYTCAKAVVK